MIFTIKILRFLFRLTLRVILFPFRLTRRLIGIVRGRSSDDGAREPLDQGDPGEAVPASTESGPKTEEEQAEPRTGDAAAVGEAAVGARPTTGADADPTETPEAGASSGPQSTDTQSGPDTASAEREASGSSGTDPGDEPAESVDDHPSGADEQPSDPLAPHRESLTAEDPATRVTAIETVVDGAEAGELPTERVVDAVVDRLVTDEAEPVRVAACRALGRLDDERARSAVASRRLDTNDRVSHAATEALRTTA